MRIEVNDLSAVAGRTHASKFSMTLKLISLDIVYRSVLMSFLVLSLQSKLFGIVWSIHSVTAVGVITSLSLASGYRCILSYCG